MMQLTTAFEKNPNMTNIDNLENFLANPSNIQILRDKALPNTNVSNICNNLGMQLSTLQQTNGKDQQAMQSALSLVDELRKCIQK